MRGLTVRFIIKDVNDGVKSWLNHESKHLVVASTEGISAFLQSLLSVSS